MVVHIPTSLKKLHEKQAAEAEVKTQIHELQDAIIEIGGLVDEAATKIQARMAEKDGGS